MAEQVTLTRDTITDYEVSGETGRVFVITRTRYFDEQGNVVSQRKHRRPVEPDADVEAEPAEVRALAELVRTPERLARAEAVPEVPRRP